MEEKLRQFVFNGLLLHDSFESLEKKQGIAVTKSGDLQPVSRVVEADFSPIVWNNACNMSSVYQAIFCIEKYFYHNLLTSEKGKRSGRRRRGRSLSVQGIPVRDASVCRQHLL